MLSLRADKKIGVPIPALNGVMGTVYFGSDDETVLPIEILVASSPKAPTVPEMRSLFKWRKNDRSNLVVIAIETKGRVHLYGPAEDRQPISVEAATAQRVLQAALEDPTPLMARRSLVSFYDNFGSTEMAGIKNKGLFATHHLRDNLPQRKDWKDLQSQGQELAKKRHRELIAALGFEISTEERNTLILKAGPEKRVIAVLLEDNETFDSPSGRFPSSPVAWGLTVAADNNVPWLIVLKKDQIRLHPGRDGVGVGQKGQAETFLELNLAQIDEEHLALLPLIFSASSLEKNGDVQKILDESSKYAVVLGARLRERVYESVVPNISIAVAKKLQSQGLAMDSEGLQKAYSITLKILFRLLFQAYAEDRGLLPAGRNEGYDANSLKTIAKRDIEANPEDFGNVVNIWHDLVQVWESIDEGNPRWQVPAYNGGLFGRDPELHPEGALIKSLELTDKVLGPALQALLIDMTEDGVRGPVDFRSLSVREFGTIYEGLLESSLSLAEVDLTVDSKDAWVPAKDDDTVMAKAGEPYFHSASGERKATGSYFTPKFVVDHLVERAIDPTIDKHLEKISGYLKSGDQATAGREFFDFRVADLAMGSAHFLVAAVDRIEAKMRSFLSIPENNVPGVIDEIHRLRKAATEALRGDEIAINEIEDPSLLRRQIARRCIYGIDINPMAVELARLAIWIHTFVPGLPMSTLNHNLVCGNALTGIGSVDEALDILIPSRSGQVSFFDEAIESSLEVARSLLTEAANASEADKAEVAAGAELSKKAKEAAQDARYIFDCAIAVRLGDIEAQALLGKQEVIELGRSDSTQKIIEALMPAHMPFLFPEVFLRKNGGFDVLIGNPPWEELVYEEIKFWSLRHPGLKGNSVARQTELMSHYRETEPHLWQEMEREKSATNYLRKTLMRGPYPGMGTGHADLYKAFAWRNSHLIRAGGVIGLVLPRTAFSALGLEEWRKSILETGSFRSLVTLKNTSNWVFQSVASQYSVGLVTFSLGLKDSCSIAGPYENLESFKNVNADLEASSVPSMSITDWTPHAAFPQLGSPMTLQVFIKMRKSPSLDNTTRKDLDFAPIQGDFNQTTDAEYFFTGDIAKGNCLINKGSSFNIWSPEDGDAFGSADFETVRAALAEKLTSQTNRTQGPFSGLDANKLIKNHRMPLDVPRIAFRDVTRASDPRTVIASLVPPKTVLTNKAPYLVNRKSDSGAEAYLLGILSSIPLDWYARRFVELGLNFFILKALAIPIFDAQSAVAKRIIQISTKLAAIDERYSTWASGHFSSALVSLTDEEKLALIHELDALVALEYGLDTDDLKHIFATFHRGWDYNIRLNNVLRYYEEWKDK